MHALQRAATSAIAATVATASLSTAVDVAPHPELWAGLLVQHLHAIRPGAQRQPPSPHHA